MTSLGLEDMEHLFRRCPISIEYWNKIKGRRWISLNYDMPLTDWILENLNSKQSMESGLPWYTIFSVMLWQTWKDKNEKIFNNK